MFRSLSLVVIVVGSLLAGSAWGFQKGVKTRSTYKDTNYGFTIELPNFPGSGPKVPGVVFAATGPLRGKFAPNVNVIIETSATTAKDYLDLSLGQIKQLGMKLHGQKTRKLAGRDAVELDYEGAINGAQTLRFLALAVIDKDRVILVTCTVPPDAFADGEAEYRACLESLKLD